MTAQLENGYTRIANEILEQIAKTKLNGTQFRILVSILRNTYGFGRRDAKFSLSFLAENTDINKRQVQRELNALIEAKVISVIEEATFSSPAVLSFNKYFDQWQLDRQVVANSSTGNETDNTTDVYLDTSTGSGLVVSTGSELDTPLFSGSLDAPEIEAPKNDPKEIYKESIKENIKERLFNFWNSRNIKVHSKFTEEISKALDKALKKWDEESISKAIQRYGVVYHDQNYFFKHKWGLANFLTQKNALPDFLDDGEKWQNYQRDQLQISPPTLRFDSPDSEYYEELRPDGSLVRVYR